MSTSTSYLPGPPTTEQTEGRRRPGPRSRTALVVAVLVLLAVGVAWVVAFSPLFGVRSVQVRGLSVLSAERVEQVAAIEHGTPLVRVDTATITRRVATLPEVASVQVGTSFPSTVVITITERTPIGYVRTHGQDELVDRTGEQYLTVAAAQVAALPRLVVPTDSGARATGEALATVAAALPASLRPHVESIGALTPSAITLVLDHGRLVRWGSAQRNAAKARVLPVLLGLRGRPEIVDVTDPDHPFVR